jgi:nucleoside-diphosphate-sugar epimerase
VIDLLLFGSDTLPHASGLEVVKGDIRSEGLLRQCLSGVDAVLHLACISNDPSFELNPALSRSINYDAFAPLVRISKESGVGRFIYASTSSVYGVSDAPEVTEEHPLVPLTDYNKYKGLCEPLLFKHQAPGFTTVTIRPATVCGYSPRLRLDLTVNILTMSAVVRGTISVFGASQRRPNIHIDDLCDLYVSLMDLPSEKIAGKTYNVGTQNLCVAEIARRVRETAQRERPELGPIRMDTAPSDDIRSYHISSETIKRELGYVPRRTIEDAVTDLCRAFRDGKLPNALDDVSYYNVKAMKAIGLR